MREAVAEMFKRYACKTQEDGRNALKEIIQEIVLLGLWRAKFFEKAAFYGGTALRILYSLDRFSEDLDFSLLKRDSSFSLHHYEQAVITELASFGFDVTIQEKIKTNESAVYSAFLKTHTLKHLVNIGIPKTIIKGIHPEEKLQVKIEIDRDPPIHFGTASHYLLLPTPFYVSTFTEPELFAGKMHALLCRNWKGRIKGRDWYDFVWFVSRGIPVHQKHLEARMHQTGHLSESTTLDIALFQKILRDKIENLNVELAKQDIVPFLRDPQKITIWSKQFFHAVSEKVKVIS
ncbi:MAG: nucleotidyl transferase AbiEii/AbiGii toxin family protein [Verrucomicrobia bacterium]|nr:nucleotidyl transferase AbiEii/AbiGii toxin family protein [Verrucomicrobiota bacterium]